MRTRIGTLCRLLPVFFLPLFVLLSCADSLAATGSAPPRLADLAKVAVAGGADAAAAVAALREAGEPGMEAMLAACPDAACTGARDALDRVCGVRDCAELRLFWYTDLAAAEAAARASGKPILSLRLMGYLYDELSCANSRFFRTAFYANREINALLRQRYVLHWRSMRPVPRVTIDFGDGSKLERTLTGNSIHYVLDARGRLVQPLPGLYGPDSFRRALLEAAEAAREAAPLADEEFADWASGHFRAQARRLEQAYWSDRAALAPAAPAVKSVEAAGDEAPTAGDEDTGAAGDPWAAASATPGVRYDRVIVAGAASKAAYEAPLLSSLVGVTDEELRQLGELHRPKVRLDEASRAFLLRKQGVTDEAEAARLVDTFERTVALDEVIDLYRTGPAILERLLDIEDWQGFDLEGFSEQIYAGVFQTPLSDPWLGLAPSDVYGALPASTRVAGPR